MSWLTRKRDVLELVKALGTEKPCCYNCDHFEHGTTDRELLTVSGAHCSLDPLKRLPPPMVQAYGCPAFEEVVPF